MGPSAVVQVLATEAGCNIAVMFFTLTLDVLFRC